MRDERFRNTIEGVTLALAISLGVMIGLSAASKNTPNAVCAERWRYQHTSADTLATVRSGCAIPTEAP